MTYQESHGHVIYNVVTRCRQAVLRVPGGVAVSETAFLVITTTIIITIDVTLLSSCIHLIYSASQTPLKFFDIFPKRLEIFSPNFTSLLYVPIYAGLQIFIQLSATLTKLCHINCDHHDMLKMSTIDRNAHWVVALNTA